MEEFISKLDSFHGYAAVKGRLNENRRDTYFIDQEERLLRVFPGGKSVVIADMGSKVKKKLFVLPFLLLLLMVEIVVCLIVCLCFLERFRRFVMVRGEELLEQWP